MMNGSRPRRARAAKPSSADSKILVLRSELKSCSDLVMRLEKRISRLEDELYRLRERVRS